MVPQRTLAEDVEISDYRGTFVGSDSGVPAEGVEVVGVGEADILDVG